MELSNRENINFSIEGYSLYDLCNIHEQQVLEAMRDIFAKTPPLCNCGICVEDIYALAMNSLPARYIQATRLDNYLRSKDFVSKATVRDKVLQAIEKVGKNPNHG